MNLIDPFLEKINNILSEHKITVYALSKITNINRSTLQKALKGERHLTLRHIKVILDALPIDANTSDCLYNDYIRANYGANKINAHNSILEILNKLTISLDKDQTAPKHSYINLQIDDRIHIYNDINVVRAVEALIYNEIQTSSEPTICIYLPFTDNLINSVISNTVNICKKEAVHILILFEFLNSSKTYNNENILIFKNVLPFVLDKDAGYELYYSYTDTLSGNGFSVYPYYIALSDKVLMLSRNAKKMAIISDKAIVESYIISHKKNINSANRLKLDFMTIENVLQYFLDNTLNDYHTYSIAYEPCLSSFAPIEMYEELIMDEYPSKREILVTIKERLIQLRNTKSKYILFNKDSIEKFVRIGNMLPFKHPYLKNCTPVQRKKILQNILYAAENSDTVIRAFSSDKINVSKNYEISSIQNYYNFIIILYDYDKIYFINNKEPIISHCLIEFFNDAIESPLTFTEEETKELILNAISETDKLIAEN